MESGQLPLQIPIDLACLLHCGDRGFSIYQPTPKQKPLLGEQNILVGNSAIGYGSSFAADKVRIAAYQVATALALAAMRAGVQKYHAVLSLAVPLNEFRYRAEIDRQLQEMGAGFVCCGRSQQFSVSASFYPEGTGTLPSRLLKVAAQGSNWRVW